MTDSRILRVFLCHASQDKSIVRELYQRLLGESWIDPWLDEEKLLPGQDWDFEIERAVEAADVVIVCLSTHGVSKEGYVQRELKFVLDIALEKPEGTIFVIPLRLDDCLVPRRLRSWQYVDYFPLDLRKRSYQRLTQSLKARHGQLASNMDVHPGDPPFEPESAANAVEKKTLTPEIAPDRLTIALPATTPGIRDLAGSILPVLFFAQLVPIMFGEYDDISRILLGITAFLNAAFLIFKREMVANRWTNLSLLLFLVSHSLVIYGEYRGWDGIDVLKPVDGLVALIVGGLHVAHFKSPRKPAPYAAIFVAVYIALYAVKVVLNVFEIYPDGIQTLMIVTAMIGAVFLWLER